MRRVETSLQRGPLRVGSAPLSGGPFGDRLLAWLGLAMDAAVLAAAQPMIDAFLLPDRESLQSLRASGASLATDELRRHPRRFFAFLDAPVGPLAATRRYRRPLAGGAVVGWGLSSGYAEHAFEAGADPADLASGQRILFEHWAHEHDRPRGVVIALHGFAMGRPRIDAVALFAHQWYERGLDVVIPTLPHHGARRPPHARFSGEHFAVPHIARLAGAVHQAVYEIRRIAAWSRQAGDGPVGLLGLSLGGYLSALCAGLLPDLDFVVPMVAPVCMGDLAARHMERSRRAHETEAPTGDELREGFRVHSPLSHPLVLPRERVMIVAGRGDRVVPPHHPLALWSHWGEPEIHWFGGSHVAPFGRRRTVEAVAAHLGRLDVL